LLILKILLQVAASVVKELRDKTGAGMMDCKKALAENNSDMEASVEWLRKKGLAGADKKAGRLAAEGVIARYGAHIMHGLGCVYCIKYFILNLATLQMLLVSNDGAHA
jgi:hypothetical protein